MVVFVLEDPGSPARKGLFVQVPLAVVVAHADVLRAEHLLVHPGDAQAAFLEAPLVAPFFQFFRVDEFPAESRQKVPFLFGQFLVLGKRRPVHHDHPHGTAHLRGSQTHPVGRIHRLEHIVDKRIQFRIVFVDLFGPFLENRFSVGHNRKFHIVFCLFLYSRLYFSLSRFRYRQPARAKAPRHFTGGGTPCSRAGSTPRWCGPANLFPGGGFSASRSQPDRVPRCAR